jgi:hypothetical protein
VPGFGRVGEAGLKDDVQLAGEFCEFGVVKPRRREVVAGPVAQRVDLLSGEVAVEVADQTGQKARKAWQCSSRLIDRSPGQR